MSEKKSEYTDFATYLLTAGCLIYTANYLGKEMSTRMDEVYNEPVVLRRQDAALVSSNGSEFTFRKSIVSKDYMAISVEKLCFPFVMYNINQDTSVTVLGNAGTISKGQYTVDELINELNSIGAGAFSKNQKSYTVTVNPGGAQITVPYNVAKYLGASSDINTNAAASFDVGPHYTAWRSPFLQVTTDIGYGQQNTINVFSTHFITEASFGQFVTSEPYDRVRKVFDDNFQINQFKIGFVDSEGNAIDMSYVDWVIVLLIEAKKN